MRVATWNVNALRARLPFVLHWLRARRPDVVGLQELKLTDEQFPHDAFAAEGYRARVLGQKAWNGVAVLSREPAEELHRGLPGFEDQGARLLTVAVGGLTFSTVYVPNGKSVEHEDFPHKLAWLDGLREFLAGLAVRDAPTVVGGDFNLCPAGIDSWNEGRFRGRIFHTDQERARFRSLLDLGLVDVFRACHPERAAFSWWDYRGGAFHRKQGLRIDFLLVGESVARRVRSVEIDRDYRKKKEGMIPSDHAPVLLDLD